MSKIEYVDDGVQIDASVLAQAFAISAEDLRLGMRDGAITSRFERGEGEDSGRVRLTFFSADRRVRMIADDRGRVLSCDAVDLRRPASGGGLGAAEPAALEPEASEARGPVAL